MKQLELLEDFKQSFPKAWVKDGKEFNGDENCLLWSGEGSSVDVTEGGDTFEMELFDYWSQSDTYEFGVHVDLQEWCQKRDLICECHDPGTYMIYKN